MRDSRISYVKMQRWFILAASSLILMTFVGVKVVVAGWQFVQVRVEGVGVATLTVGADGYPLHEGWNWLILRSGIDIDSRSSCSTTDVTMGTCDTYIDWGDRGPVDIVGDGKCDRITCAPSFLGWTCELHWVRHPIGEED